MALHDELIADLMKNPRSPRDNAAVNEIKALRDRIAELEGRGKKSKKDDE